MKLLSSTIVNQRVINDVEIIKRESVVLSLVPLIWPSKLLYWKSFMCARCHWKIMQPELSSYTTPFESFVWGNSTSLIRSAKYINVRLGGSRYMWCVNNRPTVSAVPLLSWKYYYDKILRANSSKSKRCRLYLKEFWSLFPNSMSSQIIPA